MLDVLTEQLILERIHDIWVVVILHQSSIIFNLKNIIIHAIGWEVDHLVFDVYELLCSEMLFLGNCIWTDSFGRAFATWGGRIIIDCSLGAV